MPEEQDLRAQAVKIATGLYPHQVDGVAFLMSRRRAILADDMGLGKTRQAIVAASHLEPVGPYLVVCPASVKRNWVREIEAVEQASEEKTVVKAGQELRLPVPTALRKKTEPMSPR